MGSADRDSRRSKLYTRNELTERPWVGESPPRVAPLRTSRMATQRPFRRRIIKLPSRSSRGGSRGGRDDLPRAIGFIAFPDFTDPTLPPIRSPNSAAPMRFLAPSSSRQSLASVGPRQTNEAVDPLIDKTVDAVANGSAELTSTMLERIAKLGANGSSDGFKLTLALADRLAARAGAAAAAGRIDEAQRLEQVFRLAYSAIDKPDLLTSFNQKSFESPLTAVPGRRVTALVAAHLLKLLRREARADPRILSPSPIRARFWPRSQTVFPKTPSLRITP